MENHVTWDKALSTFFILKPLTIISNWFYHVIYVCCVQRDEVTHPVVPRVFSAGSSGWWLSTMSTSREDIGNRLGRSWLKSSLAEALRFFFFLTLTCLLPCFYFVTEFLIFTVMPSKIINGPQSMQNWWRLTLISILQTLHKTVTKRHQIKCLMSKTVAVHVHHNSLYISLPSSAKQQREMTKFYVV